MAQVPIAHRTTPAEELRTSSCPSGSSALPFLFLCLCLPFLPPSLFQFAFPLPFSFPFLFPFSFLSLALLFFFPFLFLFPSPQPGSHRATESRATTSKIRTAPQRERTPPQHSRTGPRNGDSGNALNSRPQPGTAPQRPPQKRPSCTDPSWASPNAAPASKTARDECAALRLSRTVLEPLTVTCPFLTVCS